MLTAIPTVIQCAHYMYISLNNTYPGGFSMMLFAEQKEYLRSYNFGHSFRMDLHGYNTMDLVDKDPIAIATGTETFIKLKLVTMTYDSSKRLQVYLCGDYNINLLKVYKKDQNNIFLKI